MFLRCSVVWLLLLFFAQVCPSTDKHSKCRHGRHTQTHQRTHRTKKFCDPSLTAQRAGALTQLTVSVQKCSSGFYREWAGPHRSQCVPCSCNGLSNDCDEYTGNCMNCQFNTIGDHCERCKAGFYGNAADRTCRACPCPFTANNFALACLDAGSGVVECLCKRGYSGTRCERCAFGYYGNPMVYGGSCKPCNCKDRMLNICDSLTGECITPDDSSSGDQCHECDSCTLALLADLEKMDDALVWLKQQMENITNDPGSLFSLNRLQANISETKILVGRYSSAVRHLNPEVKQLEADVDVVADDLSQLIDKTFEHVLYLEKVSQNVNGTKLKAEDLLSEAIVLLTAIQDLIKRLTEVKPGEPVTISENNKAGMMEAQRIVQEMRKRGCAAQRDTAGREQEDAHTLLDTIRNMTDPAESLLASNSSLSEVAELLSDAEDAVNRTQGLNMKNHAMLQQLENLHTQLQGEHSTLLPVTDMTKDVLKNITDIFSMLEDIKRDFENHAAQLDGGGLELMKKLNNIAQIMANVQMVTKAEEHAEELNRLATEFEQVLHNATNGTDLLSILGIGAYNNIINTIEKAAMAANQSSEAADQALKGVMEGHLVSRAQGLKDNSTRFWTQAKETQNDLKMLSHTVNAHKDRVNKQKEKGKSLRMDISSASGDIKKIRKDDTEVLIESAKTAASTANSIVSDVTERLKNIIQEVERIILSNVSVNVNDMLTDADQAVKNLSKAVPALKDKITQIEALSGKVPPSANMTESIWRIKDVIEETRNYVNRLSLATNFNGKGHVELRPPRDVDDIKAFTAVDLLLNRHENSPSKGNSRHKRRQKRRDTSFFVFYLGNKNASGDYIGMAIRSNVLICVYKLGGVVQEVETSPVTTTNVNSTDFDRVILHRVYQDAEVNITQNFTSKTPIHFSLKRVLPNTMTGILNLDPGSVVFYVGGYPKNFQPPVELNYPKYRGAMKLSYINNNPVSLFNYKHAANLDPKQPSVNIRRSEVFDYYKGTGYRMALMKEPSRKKRRLIKFHINSRETDALLFYIGSEESFFCVSVERGFLVLQGRQTGREVKLKSAEKVSLFGTQFAITITDIFTVHYGQEQISTNHSQTNYTSYYIGGLPASLRQRHNITTPPLRGCVDHVTEEAEAVQYNRTIGVTDGCPFSALGVRLATLHSALSADSLFDWGERPLRVSLGFRTTDRHGILLKSSSSQGSNSVHDLQLSLADGHVVFNSDNYTLRSDKRYSDGNWHYLFVVRRSTGLELSIDNVKVTQGQSPQRKPLDQNFQAEKFTACIANLYTRRSEQSFIPADLSSFSLTDDVVLGRCSLRPPTPHTEVLPTPVPTGPQKQKPIQAPAGSRCKQQRAQHGEYQLTEEDSWLSFTLPEEDLNFRPHFSLNIKTKSSKGLILHVAGGGDVPLLALYLANGKIKMSLGKDRIIFHKEKSNDGNWHKVDFSVERNSFHLLVDGVRVTDGHLPKNEGSSLMLHNPVYLGGDPISKTTKGHNIPMNSIIGCVREFKMNEEVVGEPDESHKTLPCFDNLTEKGTYFGGGHIILDNYFIVGSQFMLAFELRPQYLTGLLFHVQSHKTSLNVFLMETKVGVEVNDGSGAVSVSVTPRESLCDGKFHVVTVSKQLEVIKLEVDSEQKVTPFTSSSHSATLDTLYIGGTTKQSGVSVSSPFVGCLRNVKINGRPVAFETGSRVVGPVNIKRCPAN